MRKFWKTLMVAVSAGAMLGHAAIAQEVTLVYGDWQAAQKTWGESLEQALAEFEAQNPNINVQLEPVALAQRDVKYTTAIRAGRGPDLFALDAPPSKQYIRNGWALDLTPFIEQESDEWLADFYPRTLDVVSQDGKIYGVPTNIMPIIFGYNSQLFEEAGVTEPPTNWEEFLEVAKKLTRASSEGGPVDHWATTIPIGPGCFDLRFTAFLRSFGARVLTSDYEHSALDQPEATEALQYFVDLVNQHKVVPPGVAQVDCHGARQLMASEKVAMLLESIWTTAILKDLNPDLHAAEVIKYIPLPTKEGLESDIHTTLYQKSLYINPHTEHPEAAWKLIKFLIAQPQMERWFTDSQNLSAIKSINENSPVISENPDAQVAMAAVEHAAVTPQIPQWPEISEALRQSVQAAVAETVTVEEALAQAHDKIEAILNRS